MKETVYVWDECGSNEYNSVGITHYGCHAYRSNVYTRVYYGQRDRQLGLFGNNFHVTNNDRNYIIICTFLENFPFSLFLFTSTLFGGWCNTTMAQCQWRRVLVWIGDIRQLVIFFLLFIKFLIVLVVNLFFSNSLQWSKMTFFHKNTLFSCIINNFFRLHWYFYHLVNFLFTISLKIMKTEFFNKNSLFSHIIKMFIISSKFFFFLQILYNVLKYHFLTKYNFFLIFQQFVILFLFCWNFDCSISGFFIHLFLKFLRICNLFLKFFQNLYHVL